MTKTTSLLLACLAGAAACHQPPRAAPTVNTPRSVFTDSAYHAAMCETPRPGDDWRTSCQPRSQQLERKFMTKPPE